jgi:hypothetical protein
MQLHDTLRYQCSDCLRKVRLRRSDFPLVAWVRLERGAIGEYITSITFAVSDMLTPYFLTYLDCG